MKQTNLLEQIETMKKQQRKTSNVTTMKSFSKIITKLKEANLITENEHQHLRELHSETLQRWINQQEII